jgi:hypothetical protein
MIGNLIPNEEELHLEELRRIRTDPRFVSLGREMAFARNPQLDIDWTEHASKLRMPSDDKLLRQWYRSRFVSFVRIELEKVGQRRNRYQWGTEEVMLKIYPQMREKWILNKQRLAVIEPTIDDLKRRWIKIKRHKFAMKRIPGFSHQKQKRRFRFDVFFNRLIWCRHKTCWILRFNVMFVSLAIGYLIECIITAIS